MTCTGSQSTSHSSHTDYDGGMNRHSSSRTSPVDMSSMGGRGGYQEGARLDNGGNRGGSYGIDSSGGYQNRGGLNRGGN